MTVLIDDSGTVEPELHESRLIELDGRRLLRQQLSDYGEVVVAERTIELSNEQQNALHSVIADAGLRESDLVDDECSGGGGVTFSATFTDGQTVNGHVDDRTFDGKPGRCRLQSMEGDVKSVVDYLWFVEPAIAD